MCRRRSRRSLALLWPLLCLAQAAHIQAPAPTFPSYQSQNSWPGQSTFNSYGTPAHVPAPAPAPFVPKTYGQVPYPAAPAYPAPAPAPSNSGPVAAPAPSYGSSQPQSTTICYKIYRNCGLANVHPFERRSKFTQQQCQAMCQGYRNACQSYVYDAANRVCDLFAITGSAYPAAFFRAHGRDYYEKISNCAVAGPAPPSPVFPGTGGGGSYGGAPGVPGAPAGPSSDSCSPRVARYLRIEGFELADNDERTVRGGVAECTRECTADPDCVSFDAAGGECRLTSEAAVPTGSGQLVEQTGSEYYEKICLDSQVSTNCPAIFNRVPQFSLVGFAEEVVTATTFEECLNQCVNARQNLGITCRSGMFYFEIPDENCILNIEDRSTQPALFVEETEDIVDYFETGCATTTVGTPGTAPYSGGAVPGQGPYASLRRSQKARARTEVKGLSGPRRPRQRPVLAEGPRDGSWTQWTPCDARFNGKRRRYRRCAKPLLSLCPDQTEACNTSVFASRRPSAASSDSASESREAVPPPSERIVQRRGRGPRKDAPSLPAPSAALRVSVKCVPGRCCPIADGVCLVGVRRSPATGNVVWCSDPC